MSSVSNQSVPRTELITNSIDKKAAGDLVINRESGGMRFSNMAEVMEFAKLMAVSGHAVPPHCRNNPGLCLGLAIQSIEWRMSPFAVAGKSYVVNDRIGYEAQLVHAVIEQRAPILSRLRHEFVGEGDKRKCRVWATARGESEPLSYTSPEISKITPKNSPLWKSKPDLQLYYNTSRDWARVYFPDVILGVYAEDEIEALVADNGGPRLAGMEGLKARIMHNAEAAEATASEDDAPQDEPADESEAVDEDLNQADPYSGPASSATPEELAEQARGGTLFDQNQD